jgi:hypothetical protein
LAELNFFNGRGAGRIFLPQAGKDGKDVPRLCCVFRRMDFTHCGFHIVELTLALARPRVERLRGSRMFKLRGLYV